MSKEAIDCFLLVVNRCFDRGLSEEDVEKIFFPPDDGGGANKKTDETGLSALAQPSTPNDDVGSKRHKRGSIAAMMTSVMRKKSATPNVVDMEVGGVKDPRDRQTHIGVNDFSTSLLKLAGKSYAPTKSDTEEIVCAIQSDMGLVAEADVGLSSRTLMSYLEKNVFLKVSETKRKKSARNLGIKHTILHSSSGLDTDGGNGLDREKAKRWGIMYEREASTNKVLLLVRGALHASEASTNKVLLLRGAPPSAVLHTSLPRALLVPRSLVQVLRGGSAGGGHHQRCWDQARHRVQDRELRLVRGEGVEWEVGWF
jgi:hypothetical protein